ncbi:MAG: hypothetical protein KGS72_03885 [Cyanobacteria bacterium REEB67]|nr:hypothetical protein [Cyanobacteria bacterium REEB67]
MSEGEQTYKNYTDANFSDAAVALLSVAADECKAAGAEKISSEHLLLALIADESGAAGSLLRARGLKVDSVRKQARKFAEEAAEKSGLNQMHTHGHEHAPEHGHTAESGHAHTRDHDHERDQDCKGKDQGDDGAPALEFAALGKWILTGALEQATLEGCEQATPEHILVALLEEGTGVAIRLLDHFKINLQMLHLKLSRQD